MLLIYLFYFVSVFALVCLVSRGFGLLCFGCVLVGAW